MRLVLVRHGDAHAGSAGSPIDRDEAGRVEEEITIADR
jgi:hypothetical protein